MHKALETAVSGAKLVGRTTFFLGLSASALALQTSAFNHQDMPALLGKGAENRWLMHIGQPVVTSTVSIDPARFDLGLIDQVVTNSIPEDINTSEAAYASAVPQRINRVLKGNRVVHTAARKAPKAFTAGSVIERQSFLDSLEPGKRIARMFVTPKSSDEALQVAMAFHFTRPKSQPATENLPVMVADLVEHSKDSVLAFVPEPKVEYSPFSAVLVEQQPVKITPKLNQGDHSWAADPLPKSSFSKHQQKCLASGIYFEARGEPVKGQAAVSQVILNRVRNPHYPNSICGVVYQNKHWTNRCQFSFACDRIRDRIKSPKLYEIARHVAKETTAGRIWLSEVGSSTHYHATYVNPDWNRRMKRLGRIGLHIFYRTHNGGWS